MRAALESLAFELARRSHAASLTATQEKASTFRAVQPFINIEQAHRRGVGLERTYPEEFRWALLHRWMHCGISTSTGG